MKIIKPSYEIISCPDGEACLTKLERIARVAYKSEDLIDDGFGVCTNCFGGGWVEEDCYRNMKCPECKGAGKSKERIKEPSSHKLIRSILKTNRRPKLTKKAATLSKWQELMDGKRILDNNFITAISEEIVNMVLNVVRDDPPHESVIEHESITVLFISNRGMTHEAVRHRLCAFTQESTRYANYSKDKFGSEISIAERESKEINKSLEAFDEWTQGILEVEKRYMNLIKLGIKPEIARDLLPQILKTEIVVTTNLREWRHIFNLRCSPKAHPDIRSLMISLREDLRQRIPIIFDEV